MEIFTTDRLKNYSVSCTSQLPLRRQAETRFELGSFKLCGFRLTLFFWGGKNGTSAELSLAEMEAQGYKGSGRTGERYRRRETVMLRPFKFQCVGVGI